jgi:hypothetical protein
MAGITITRNEMKQIGWTGEHGKRSDNEKRSDNKKRSDDEKQSGKAALQIMLDQKGIGVTNVP